MAASLLSEGAVARSKSIGVTEGCTICDKYTKEYYDSSNNIVLKGPIARITTSPPATPPGAGGISRVFSPYGAGEPRRISPFSRGWEILVDAHKGVFQKNLSNWPFALCGVTC